MSEKARVTLLHPPNLFGSERYSLTVEIVNTSDNPLTDINVNAVLIPGKNLSYQEDKKFKESTKYELEISELLEEINLQVNEAYKILNAHIDEKSANASTKNIGRIQTPIITMNIKQRVNQDSNTSKLKRILRFLNSELIVEELDFLPVFKWESDSSYLRKLASKEPIIPIWAKTATRIEAWEDLESVQELLINQLPDDSFLKKSFFINKQKLKVLEGNRLPNQRDEDNIFRSVKLFSGQRLIRILCKRSRITKTKETATC
ncbi:hypothetical protein [Pseudanabaena sp. PCC 6802]|uniref:hypothetical protein n=1 Tax=Pseudanabaena sp. PCC 6802 TaxID=118173 RepID=UPI00034634F2|nr:hypothetical protein [Pseudanabaena sp. PCC 6802]